MNFSISEILVIVLVALLVIKPQDLPQAMQVFGQLLKTIRQFFAKLKMEVDEMVNAREADK